MSLFDELTERTGQVLTAVGPAVVRIGRAEGRGAGIVVGSRGGVDQRPQPSRGRIHRDLRRRAVARRDRQRRRRRRRPGRGRPSTPAASLPSVGPNRTPAVPGAPVFALALPIGGGEARITFGTVSAIGRSFRGPRGRLITDGIEHTAPLGRGSSGGPVVDTEGRLVAINTHRPGDGFYLALPATAALRTRVDALARGEAPDPAPAGRGARASACGPTFAGRGGPAAARRRARPRRGRRQPGGHGRAVARRPDRHRRRAAGHVDR